MSFFSRLFGKAPSPPAATRPTGAPGRVSAAAAQTTAKHVGSQTGSVTATLPSGDELIALAMNPQAAAHKVAQRHLAQMLDAGKTDVARLHAQIADKIILLSIVAQADNAMYVDQVAGLIGDTPLWPRLVTEGASTKIRQLAAERVDDAVQLRRLLKETRGRDKNAYKIIRRKCDALQAQDKALAERQAAIVALGESIERHSYKPFDGAFVATLEHLSSQWQAIATQAPEELQPRVGQALERARETISEHVRAVGAQAARSHAIETADPQRQLIVEEMRAALATAFADATSHDLVARAKAQLDRWTERWSATTRHKPASAGDSDTLEQLRGAIERAARSLEQHGTLRQQLAALQAPAADADLSAPYQALRATLAATRGLPDIRWPADVATALEALQRWEQQRADAQAASAAALSHIGGLIRRANRAINDGRSGQAAGIRRAIAEAVPALHSVPAHLAGQIEQLDKRLHELQDWKSYAVAPKRAQLIEQMQALVGANEAPPELADRIRQLQDEWKSLHRGGAGQSEADWEVFHQAAEAAYQPCREYFAAQARIRESNLLRRKALLDDIVRFDNGHDWANADWKEVARVLRHARQEWRNANPVDRTANKSLQALFDEVLKNLQDRLDAQYRTNSEHKQSLIQQVQRLSNEPDTRKAIEDVKRLQTAWKMTGLVSHQEDQRLWEEFRQYCDAVYRRSQEAYAKFAAELEANRARAVDLCTQAEACAGLTSDPLYGAAAQVGQLRDDFDALGELPRGESGDLKARFERAIRGYEHAVREQRLQEERQSWSHLFAASNEVRLFQLAGLEKSEAELEALRQSVRSTIDGVLQWPKGGLQAIERKLAQPASADVAVNEAALRKLCIRAEILTDTPTPTADQPLRREHQLQSLVQGMGQSADSRRDSFEALVFEWIAVGPTSTNVYYELLERFNDCLVKVQRLG